MPNNPSRQKERLAQAALGEGEHDEPVLRGDLAWDAWAGPAKLGAWKAEDLIQFVRGRLLPGLSTLIGSPLARTIAGIFSDESVGDQNVVRNVPVCASGYNPACGSAGFLAAAYEFMQAQERTSADRDIRGLLNQVA